MKQLKHNLKFIIAIDYNAEDAIKILEYTDGNRVKTVKIGNLELSRSRGKNLIRIKVCKF